MLFAAGLLAGVAGGLIIALPALIEAAVPWWLARQGLPGASLRVAALSSGGLDLADVRLGPQVRAARLRLSWLAPWQAGGPRLTALAADGLSADLTLTPDGLDAGGAEALVPPEMVRQLLPALPPLAAGRLRLHLSADTAGSLPPADSDRPPEASGSAVLRLTAEEAVLPGLGLMAGTAELTLSGGSQGLALALAAPARLTLEPEPELATMLPVAGKQHLALDRATLMMEPAAPGHLRAQVEAAADITAGTSRLSLDGALNADMTVDGTVRTATIKRLSVDLAGLPMSGGIWDGKAEVRDMSGPLAALQAPAAHVTLHARDLHPPESALSLPAMTLDAVGPVDWRPGALTLGLTQGTLSVPPGGRLGGLRLTRPLTWALTTPVGQQPALALLFGDGQPPRLPLTARALRPRLEGSLSDRPLRLSFAEAEVAAPDLLAAGPSAYTFTARQGSGDALGSGLERADLQVSDGPQGLGVTLRADLVRLPGEETALPPGPLRPLAVEATAIAPGPEQPLALTATVQRPDGQRLARLSGRHHLDSGKGQVSVSMDPVRFGAGGIRPGHLYAAMADVTFTGSLEVDGTLAWTDDAVTSALEVTVGEGNLEAAGIAITGLNGVFRLDKPFPPHSPPGQEATAALIEAGLPFTDAQVRFQLDGAGGVRVEQATLTLAGGTLRTQAPFSTPLDLSRLDTTLSVEGLDLQALAALAAVEGLEADGILDGTLPLRVADGAVSIDQARLTARGPGTLRYRPSTPPAALGGASAAEGGLDLVLRALSDFQYHALELTADGTVGDSLQAGLHISGANPALYDGYPIELNLALSGALAEALSAGAKGVQLHDRLRSRLGRMGPTSTHGASP